MNISEFAPVIQLAATMNAAFVVVEYANSFTKVIAENICRHPDLISGFRTSYDNKVKDLNVDNLKEHVIDGKSTVLQIEKIKKDREVLQNKIGTFENELNQEMNDICNSHCFSFLSLYMFLYCILALFLVNDIQEQIFIRNIWGIISILSCCFLICCIFFGEKKKIRCFVQNLEYSIYLLVVTIIVSIVTALVINLYSPIEFVDNSVLSLITSIIPYIGFIAYAIIIKTKSMALRKSIADKSKKLDADFDTLSIDIKPHLNMNELTFAMNDNSNE